MKQRIILFFLSLFLLCSRDFFGQINIRDSSVVAPMVCSSYSLQLPGADMAKRFGINSAIGLQFLLKTKANWIFGASGDFLFGNQVNEKGILDSIATPDGFLISRDGKLVDYHLFERGFTTFLKFGKLFPMWGLNPNSGLFVIGGLGFMEHKIRIELVGESTDLVPQLSDQMKKGYDRLSNGIAFSQTVGYIFLSNNRIANFFAGLEISESLTKDRRSFDYDLMKKNTELRTDILYGIRIGWILPIYKRAPKEFYTN